MPARFAARFARETVEQVQDEIKALMVLHWTEVGHYRDLPLDPDFERYALVEKAGLLRIYTARAQFLEKDSLRGYVIYIVGPGIHYRQTLFAVQSTLYLHPAYRAGLQGARFIRWTETQLEEQDGIQVIHHHVKAKHDPRRAAAFMRMLERRGYELQDYVLSRKVR
jgi:hypothetical protein